jgi:K+-transporting ATPase ATPase C chain
MLQALRFTLIIFLLSGVVYPLAVTGLGQALFPEQANGSLIRNEDGVVIGAKLIGQNFSRPEYFHPRPSANGYDGANSGGANYGATNRKLIERIQAEMKVYQHNNASTSAVPMDAVTTSASGLDPHISLENALNQVPRVARARHLPPTEVKKLVLSQQEKSLFNKMACVNVLRLNRTLDALKEHS